jgi:hypothetical protein
MSPYRVAHVAESSGMKVDRTHPLASNFLAGQRWDEQTRFGGNRPLIAYRRLRRIEKYTGRSPLTAKGYRRAMSGV